jgi:myo-inositol 2-dehydrogenase / D-chiro-inositol 1-dehydrogenase
MSDRLGIALIGAGRQGQAHLAAAADAARVELRAVCDVVAGAAAAVAPPGVAADTEVARTLARDDVAAVVIAASTHRHAELVEAALTAGRHVLCEKPLTLTEADDARLAALAAARGLVLHVGFNRRHGWPYREAVRLIAAGAIGAPRMARCAQWDAESPPPEFLDPASSGGLEIDCGIHEMDTAAWLLGSPIARVAAVGAPTRPEIAAVGDLEAAAGLAVTAAGHAVTIDLHRQCRYADIVHTEVVGAEGALLIRFEGPGSLELGDGDGLRAVPGPAGEAIHGALAAQLDALAAAVAGEPTGAAGAADSTRALAAARAMREARDRDGYVALATP